MAGEEVLSSHVSATLRSRPRAGGQKTASRCAAGQSEPTLTRRERFTWGIPDLLSFVNTLIQF
jgi:hypothetical protein